MVSYTVVFFLQIVVLVVMIYVSSALGMKVFFDHFCFSFEVLLLVPGVVVFLRRVVIFYMLSALFEHCCWITFVVLLVPRCPPFCSIAVLLTFV